MEALTEHLADPAFRETLKARMLTGGDFENISLLAGFENIVVSSIRLDRLRQYEGQSIAQIAEQQGKDPFTCLFDLLQAAHCDVTMIDFTRRRTDICDILRDAAQLRHLRQHLSHHRHAPPARLRDLYHAAGAFCPRKAGPFA